MKGAYCGFFFVVIIDGELLLAFVFAADFIGGADLMFGALLPFKARRNSGGSFDGSTGVFSCFFTVAASGIPGIFSPGFSVWIFGPPLDEFTARFVGGATLAFVAAGGDTSPDVVFTEAVFADIGELAAEFVFADGVEPQPKLKTRTKSAKKNGTACRIFILRKPHEFKITNAGLNVASLGDSHGVQTGTGRC